MSLIKELMKKKKMRKKIEWFKGKQMKLLKKKKLLRKTTKLQILKFYLLIRNNRKIIKMNNNQT